MPSEWNKLRAGGWQVREYMERECTKRSHTAEPMPMYPMHLFETALARMCETCENSTCVNCFVFPHPLYRYVWCSIVYSDPDLYLYMWKVGGNSGMHQTRVPDSKYGLPTLITPRWMKRERSGKVSPLTSSRSFVVPSTSRSKERSKTLWLNSFWELEVLSKLKMVGQMKRSCLHSLT